VSVQRSSAWARRRTSRLVGTLDDCHIDLLEDLTDRLLKRLALIAAVAIQREQNRKPAEQGGHQHRPAVAVLDVGGMHNRLQHQAQGVDPAEEVVVGLDPGGFGVDGAAGVCVGDEAQKEQRPSRASGSSA
jgi:hypothetical protein